MSLAISIKPDPALARKIAAMIEANKSLEPKVSAVVRSSANIVTNNARDLVPVSTGALFGSIKFTIFGNGLAAIIGSHLPYAARQEFDQTLNHSVRPVRLRTRDTSSGRKGTRIKGTNQDNPRATWGFLRKGLAKEEANYMARLRDLVLRFGGSWGE